jgi:methyl-accepting chemotaxis protein
MLHLTFKNVPDLVSKYNAIDTSQAVIEFKPDGTIITANKNFLGAVGYSLEEIKGKHHRIFVEAQETAKPEYAKFWQTLASGQFLQAEYKRIRKNGDEIWIQASYNPMFNSRGKVIKVIKFAADITAAKLRQANFESQIDAIGRSQAVIEFELDGTIINANQNFLSTVGYGLDEIKGRHHRIFVEKQEASSPEYAKFWQTLASGQFLQAEYKRIRKNGDEIWIQASYNPIFDASGKPYRIVKYATDVTSQVKARIEKDKLIKAINADLQNIAEAMTNSRLKSSNATDASNKTSDNVSSVASCSEELNASVAEIAQSMERSRAAVEGAYEQTVQAGESTAQLAQASKSMGGIVSLIQDIAGQINLLSLNATIEAARAGEAGKGFAVVADEVKKLANEASNATGQINTEIQRMQNVASTVISALELIKTSVDSVRTYVTGTAGAIEEQSAVAREMAQNMQAASSSVSSINQDLIEITDITVSADNSIRQVKSSVSTLAA